MRTGNHIVYFVGGPRDLSKQVFPGDRPQNNRVEFLQPTPLNWDDFGKQKAGDVTACVVRRDVYLLYPMPMNRNAMGEEFWIGVYDETRRY